MPCPLTVSRDENEIAISGDFVVQGVRRVLALLDAAVSRKACRQIRFDFSDCTLAFPEAMLPICARVLCLQRAGVKFHLELPRDVRLKKLFLKTGWAHLIAPAAFPAAPRGVAERSFPVARFYTDAERASCRNVVLEDLINLVPDFSHAAITAVERALDEVTANVVDHSESEIGGLLQVSVYPSSCRVEVTVADAGVGVATTLRTTRSSLVADRDALLQAVRFGVSRKEDAFQGIGLYGSLEVCRVGRGRFSLNSGTGALFLTNKSIEARHELIDYRGTTVGAIVDFSEPRLLERALAVTC